MKKQDDQVNVTQRDVLTQEAVPEAVGEAVPPEVKPESQEQEWKDKYYRVLADYQNLEKRSELRRLEAQVYAAEATLRKIIPAVDSLERAVKHIDDQGLALSLKEFYAALESCGVSRIPTVGELFDPYAMECIQMIDEGGTRVVEEIQSGYKLHDKVLRVAQVNVGNKKNN
jgi:molecular chaperone GrpE